MEDVEEEAAAVVPDGVVLGVLLEEGGDLLESGVCEVAGFDLWSGKNVLASGWSCSRVRRRGEGVAEEAKRPDIGCRI
jgi:hypothetical protein